ncbi:methyltransferase family protein [Desulfosporosinus meridiei DSM 13257]|uniref:Methyltransferase family protein n=1 Tax=Desulfosporosinus meridiei (strain ATCC BAA-275 / DSM 13257 / KCTC 12902 / NCIMB 13706 / S10) TaxID=768704 RepID=J7ITI6_DESMD|nr:class I SAM-dependent methyltransferase [Desulfosporosinus meridiei]AFQ42408.1 methyltransferase family protein [Desulfosporosinus meridiei DSM 13257]
MCIGWYFKRNIEYDNEERNFEWKDVRPVINVVNHKDFLNVINELLSDSNTVLDVGCGVGETLEKISCPIKIGVDAHRPYLENARASEKFIKLNFRAERLRELFLPKSIDSVTMIDVIEHFEKEDALDVLSQVEEIATKRVVIFTPRGFFRQLDIDHYNLGGESFQRHRSGWEVEDFEKLGYNTVIFSKFHDHSNKAFLEVYGKNATPVDALLAWKDC